MVIATKKLLKVTVKHDGNKTKIAKELGISRPAVSKRIKNNPHIQKAILNVREEAIKKAGLSRAFVYRGIKQGCQAKVVIVTENKDGKKVAKLTSIADHGERKHFLKIALLLHKDLEPDKEQSVQNIGAIIFQVLTNPNRERIQVV
jgi:predicted transcriptional regulator